MADAKLTSIADLTENYDSSTGQLTVVIRSNSTRSNFYYYLSGAKSLVIIVMS